MQISTASLRRITEGRLNSGLSFLLQEGVK